MKTFLSLALGISTSLAVATAAAQTPQAASAPPPAGASSGEDQVLPKNDGASPQPGSQPDGLGMFPPPSTPGSALDPRKPGIVRLHIEATNPNVGLYETVFTGALATSGMGTPLTMSQRICVAPCDKLIDGSAGQDFYFAGDGIRASSKFQLADRSGPLTAKVDAGSTRVRGGGIGLTVGGGVVLLLGSIFYANYLSLKSSTSIFKLDDTVGTVGGVCIVAGIAMVIPGIIMLATSGTDHKLINSTRDAALLRF